MKWYLNILNKKQQSEEGGFCIGVLLISITKDGQPVILFSKDYKELKKNIFDKNISRKENKNLEKDVITKRVKKTKNRMKM